MIDIGIPALSKIENGKSYPKPHTLQKIIDVLLIQPDILFKTTEKIDIEEAHKKLLDQLEKIKYNESLFTEVYYTVIEQIRNYK